MNFKYAIVLTGGIGSGKSTIASFLKLYGYEVVCADSIAHTLLDQSAKEITEIFGNEILENNKINRKKLGEIVFSNKKSKETLERILHPKIKEEILKLDDKSIPSVMKHFKQNYGSRVDMKMVSDELKNF